VPSTAAASVSGTHVAAERLEPLNNERSVPSLLCARRDQS